jgi:hypothetical protein
MKNLWLRRMFANSGGGKGASRAMAPPNVHLDFYSLLFVLMYALADIWQTELSARLLSSW